VAAAVAVIVVGKHRTSQPTPAGVPPVAAAPTATPTSLLSIGEVVFQYGVGPDGSRIPRSVSQSEGGGMMGGGMGMFRAGCATCHGADGRGRSTMMFTAPDIAYANLTDPQGMLMPDGTRDVTYTDATLRRAITTGVGPDGDHLEWPMPQWQLTDQEWEGLLAYLKTLR
jgi:cytochrome c1